MKKLYFILATALIFYSTTWAQNATSFGGLQAMSTTAGVGGSASNSFFGHEAGNSNNLGHNNTFIGYRSGHENFDGFTNAFIGSYSGYNNINGINNTFIGHNTGYSNISGNNNTFIGRDAGSGNLASDNTSVGYRSGWQNINGTANVFLGNESGENSTGGGNTFLGNASGRNSGGELNTFVGNQSGYNNAGDNNTFLGRSSGYNNQTGSGNVFLGSQAGGTDVNTSNELFIDNSDTASPLIWGNFEDGNEQLEFNANVRITDMPMGDILDFNRILVTDINGNIRWRSSFDDADADPNNEIQALSFTAGVITLNNDPNATIINLSNYDSDVTDDFNGSFNNLSNIPVNLDIDATDDFDGDFTNLTNLPAGLIDGDDINDADADPSNEIQALNFTAGVITLNNDPNATIINLSNYDSDVTDDFSGSFNDLTDVPANLTDGDDVDDADADPLNEIQTLNYNNLTQTLSISNGNSIDVSILGTDNLGDHSVIQDLLPDTDNLYNLGALGISFNNIHFNGALHVNNEEFLHGRRSSVAIGNGTLNNVTTGRQNVAIGENALTFIDSGTRNTAIGYETGPSNFADGGITNSTAIGNGATVTASNQVRIGNAFVTDIGGFAPWTDLSDGRFKNKIEEDVPGLEFIEKLRPVSYELNSEKLHTFLTGKKATAETISKDRHNGFIAQEVAQIVAENGYAFWGVKKPANDRDNYGLKYAQFVVPLTKAVQELSALVEAQQQKIAQLENMVYATGNTSSPASATTAKETIALPEGFVLEQNIPNPFHQATTISAMLPESVQQAKIIIYNLQGLELESYPLTGRGHTSVEISGGHFPSGMYLYALIADDRIIDTRKMILTR